MTDGASTPDVIGPGASRRPYPALIVFSVMAVLFSASLAVRAPYLGRPMGLHHEEGTARTLIHTTAWWADGSGEGGYLLRMNLSSPGDRYLGSDADENGDTFYYSFPPGHPLWAFAAHKAVGVKPTVSSVRTFNLVLHLACALMIFLIVRELLRRLPFVWSSAAGLVAFAVYLFAPVAMWYQSNAYTSASAVQPFFIGAVLLVALAYRGERRVWILSGFGAAVFLATYTEWLGLAFAGVAVVVAIVRRRDSVARSLGIAAAAGAATAMGLVVLQYSTKLGLAGVFDTMAGRYADRSGLEQGVGYTLWNPAAWSRLFGIYRNTLGPVIVVLIVLVAWDLLLRRGSTGRFRAGTAPMGVVFAFAVAPVLVHHVVLFDHTVIHDFDALKSTVPLVLGIGYLSGRIIARTASGEGRRLRVTIAGLAVVAAVACSASVIVFGNVNGTAFPQPKQLGERIAGEVRPDEVVFVQAAAYLPRSILVHYAGRNYVVWQASPTKAAAMLERGGGRTGVLFWVDEFLDVKAVGYVGIDGVVNPTREQAGLTLGR